MPTDGAVYVNVTGDGKYLFVANEDGGSTTVVDLATSRLVGNVPTGEAPIALTLSPDGSRLYSTSEIAQPGLYPSACKNEGSGADMVPPGEVEVIDVARAERTPAQAVIATLPSGCSPVRLVLSAEGATAYVTARGEDAVLAFDTGRMITDPAHVLVARATVGTAPVGIALVADRLIVADSNRFATPHSPQSLTVLSADWNTWGATSVPHAEIAAGGFPGEERVGPDGKTLYVTNTGSRQLEMIDLNRLPPLAPESQSGR